MTEKKNIGLIGGSKKGTSGRNQYVPDPRPQSTYGGIDDTTTVASSPKPEEIDYSILSQERGTMRPPLEQKLEFAALLQVSDYQYEYELLAELIYNGKQQLSKENEQKYQMILQDLRRKEAKKQTEKKNRKK